MNVLIGYSCVLVKVDVMTAYVIVLYCGLFWSRAVATRMLLLFLFIYLFISIAQLEYIRVNGI